MLSCDLGSLGSSHCLYQPFTGLLYPETVGHTDNRLNVQLRLLFIKLQLLCILFLSTVRVKVLKMICYTQTLVCCLCEVVGYCCQCPNQQQTKQLLYRTKQTKQKEREALLSYCLSHYPPAAAIVKDGLGFFGDPLFLEWLVQGDIAVNSILLVCI